MVDLSVEVKLLASAVHSGVFGGPVGDALTALCRLLATLHTEDGTVAVSGLRVDSSETPDVEEAAFRAAAGLVPTARLLGRGSINDRRWHQPALAVIGIDSPSTGTASSVLLPRARAKLSLRIAPGEHVESAAKALTAHLLEHAPWGAEVTVTEDGWGEPFAFDATGDVYELARSVFAEAYSHEAVDVGLGGSIPFIAEFTRAYPSSTVLVTGVRDPGSRWHGIDESLDLGMWEKACLAELLLLHGLASKR